MTHKDARKLLSPRRIILECARPTPDPAYVRLLAECAAGVALLMEPSLVAGGAALYQVAFGFDRAPAAAGRLIGLVPSLDGAYLHGGRPAHWAARYGALRHYPAALLKRPEDIRDNRGGTILHWAYMFGADRQIPPGLLTPALVNATDDDNQLAGYWGRVWPCLKLERR